MTNKVIVKNPTDTIVYNTGYDPGLPQNGGPYTIKPWRPAVADLDDPFIQRQLKEKRLEILPGPKLPDSVTDEDFRVYWDEDPENAVKEFYLLGEGTSDEKAPKLNLKPKAGK